MCNNHLNNDAVSLTKFMAKENKKNGIRNCTIKSTRKKMYRNVLKPLYKRLFALSFKVTVITSKTRMNQKTCDPEKTMVYVRDARRFSPERLHNV